MKSIPVKNYRYEFGSKMAEMNLHSTIRAFLALPLDESISKKIAYLVKELKQHPHADRVRWVAPPNLHLTLNFFGQFPQEKLPALCSKLGSQIAAFPSFVIDYGKILLLPHERHPHALSLHVELSEPLAAFYRVIQLTLQDCGFSPEARPFLPHVTIGRIRGHFSLDKEVKFQAYQLVEKLNFYQSRTSSEGPVYEILETFYLAPSTT
jgi:2'-5' RNA ligase